ncbi:hypothetical protein BD779DRAFT_1525103 [Infundibulicybe gibba]|nr:hypothetical protein BD779DRAFT_1525103 [Infundibulicybe gibba]
MSHSSSHAPSQRPSQLSDPTGREFRVQPGGGSPSMGWGCTEQVNQNPDGSQTFVVRWQGGHVAQPSSDLQSMWAESMAARSEWQRKQQHQGRQRQAPIVAVQSQAQHGTGVPSQSNVQPLQITPELNNAVYPTPPTPQTPSSTIHAAHGIPTPNHSGSSNQNNGPPPA